MTHEKTEITTFVDNYLEAHNYKTPAEKETGLTILACKLSDTKATSLGIECSDKYGRAYYALKHPALVAKDEEPSYVIQKRIYEMMAWA